MHTAVVTGIPARQHDIAAALEQVGFTTICPEPGAFDGLRAAVPPSSLGCYVQLPLEPYEPDDFPLTGLQRDSAELMARVQWVAVVAPLLEPGATVVLVPGEDPERRWDGREEIEFLAEMLRTHPVVSASKIVVAGAEHTPMEIAGVAG